MAIDPVSRKTIWDEYERQRPRQGEAFTIFCESLSSRLNLTPQEIRRVIAKQVQALNNQITQATLTTAQNIANLIGADMTEAMVQARDMLNAMKRKPLLDKSGKPQFHPETGELMFLEEPDWQARSQAIRLMAQIHGMFAPQQYEVKGQHTVTYEGMDQATLEARWKELEQHLVEYQLMPVIEAKRGKRPKTIDIPANGNILQSPDAGAGVS